MTADTDGTVTEGLLNIESGLFQTRDKAGKVQNYHVEKGRMVLGKGTDLPYTTGPGTERSHKTTSSDPERTSAWKHVGMGALGLLLLAIVISGIYAFFTANRVPLYVASPPPSVPTVSTQFIAFTPPPATPAAPTVPPNVSATISGTQPAGNAAMLPNLTLSFNPAIHNYTQNGIGTAGSMMPGAPGQSNSGTNSGVVQNSMVGAVSVPGTNIPPATVTQTLQSPAPTNSVPTATTPPAATSTNAPSFTTSATASASAASPTSTNAPPSTNP